ncbi:hypothetical protein ISF12_11130 [Pseudomonas aeruginosa]|nr:hypothetical protein [Pseudomonas aeruginosa]
MQSTTALEQSLLSQIEQHMAEVAELARYLKVPLDDAKEVLFTAQGSLDAAEALRPHLSAETAAAIEAHKVTYSKQRELIFDASVDASDLVLKMLEKGQIEDEGGFLHCWMYGEFDSIRREWPELDSDIFVGPDSQLTLPLRDPA